MKRSSLLLGLLLLGAGCAGRYSPAKSAPGWGPAPSSAQANAPSPFAQMEVQAADQRAGLSLLQDGGGRDEQSVSAGKAGGVGGSVRGREPGDKKARGDAGSGSQQAEQAEQAEQPQPPEPLVVYMGYLKLRVKRLIEALDRITALTEQAGGYIESMTADSIIVRVPAKGFDAALKAFTELGDVLDRRVKAMDVSEQYTDLSARLAVAKRARERLLVLLEQVQDVSERLKILQEIKRLSEQIEAVESSLSTLRTLLDFSTISVDLLPVIDSSQVRVSRSPFAWVRGLRAHVRTLSGARSDVTLPLPSSFVLFDKEDGFRAQAADTTTLRVGSVRNEPRGDNPFWSAAVHHELDGREEEQLSEGAAAGLTYRIYRSRDLRPRCYLVAVQAAAERLYVVEAFFPNEVAYEAHREGVLTALKSFRVKQ